MSKRNIVFKICDVILLNEIVHFVIHTFHQVLTVLLIRRLLEHTLLHVLIEVPGYDFQDAVLMVFGDYLQPVPVLSLNKLDDFNVLREIDNGISENNPICRLQLELVICIIFLTALLWILLKETIFKVLAAVDHYEVFVVYS